MQAPPDFPDVPDELARLLRAGDARACTSAWAAFLDVHGALLLRIARASTASHDAAMDAFAHLLDALRADGCRRLRGYAPQAGARFTTWLAVVARRCCMDWHRQRTGRARAAEGDEASELRRLRRRLAMLAGEELDAADTERRLAVEPDVEARLDEEARTEALHAVLDTLEPADRLLLQLRIADGLPASRVARLVGLPSPFHVYRRVNALLPALRRALAARGIEATHP